MRLDTDGIPCAIYEGLVCAAETAISDLAEDLAWSWSGNIDGGHLTFAAVALLDSSLLLSWEAHFFGFPAEDCVMFCLQLSPDSFSSCCDCVCVA